MFTPIDILTGIAFISSVLIVMHQTRDKGNQTRDELEIRAKGYIGMVLRIIIVFIPMYIIVCVIYILSMYFTYDFLSSLGG